MIGDEMGSLRARMVEVLKEEAEVTCNKNAVDLEIRDIKETTTAKEVHAALGASRRFPDIASGAFKPLREAYGKTEVAFVRLPDEIARRIMGETGLTVTPLPCRPLRSLPGYRGGNWEDQVA